MQVLASGFRGAEGKEKGVIVRCGLKGSPIQKRWTLDLEPDMKCDALGGGT